MKQEYKAPEATSRKIILLVGGEDIHLRISSMQFLSEHRFRVIVLGSTAQPTIEDAGFEYHMYSLNRSLSPWSDFRTIKELRQIITDISPTIVHSFDTKPGFMVPLSMIGIKNSSVIRTITGMGSIFSESTLRSQILRIIYWLLHRIARIRVDFTIFQNTTDMAYFERNRLVREGEFDIIRGSGVSVPDWYGRKTQIRIEVRNELGLSDKDFIFLMVARLVRQKGVADALTAAKSVLKLAPESKFIFVGPSGDDEPDGVSPSDFEGYGDHIRYIGRRSDVDRLLIASDVFLLPTRYREGVPRALLEALVSGITAIVSDMPGCIEPVMDSQAGWVVPAGDVNALSFAMKEALNTDAVTRQEMGERGKAEVTKNYALAGVIAKTLSIYKRFTI